MLPQQGNLYSIPVVKSGNRIHSDTVFKAYTFVVLVITVSIFCLIAYTEINYIKHEKRNELYVTAATRERHSNKIILFWNNFGTELPYEFGLGHRPFVSHRCPIHSCMTTDDRSLLPRADVVIFHVRGLEEESKRDLPRHQHPAQLFVFFTLESPIHTYHDMTKFNDYFNLTFSYRADSDIYCPTGKVLARSPSQYLPHMDKTLQKISSAKTKMVAWVISACDKEGSMRWQYGQQLAKYIDIDIYGDCGHLKCPKNDFGSKCYSMISKKYHFYLGFENSYCRDYVTEKLWRTMQYDMVPVVLGGTNYSGILPPKSFINVADFESPKHLAEFLQHLADQPREYLEYLRWKEKLRLRTITNLRRDGFCQLCEMLHAPSKYRFKEKFDVHQWWDVDGHCLAGEELSRTLGLPPGTSGP